MIIDNQHNILNRFINKSQYIVKYQKALNNYECYLFNNISEFLKYHDNTDNLFFHEFFHEKINYIGRFIIDFDIHINKLHNSFINDIEYYINKLFIECTNITEHKFIWLKSNTPEKISYHLIIHNAVLNYIDEMKYLYTILNSMLKDSELFSYITCDIFDSQICKKNTTLRMCYSKKRDKDYIFTPLHDIDFVDTLATGFMKTNPFEKYKHKVVILTKINKSIIIKKQKDIPSNSIQYYCDMLYKKDDSFRYYQTYGNLISFIRTKKSKCIISGIEHEHENIFLLILNRGKDTEEVRYYCRRGCKYNLDINYYELYNSISRYKDTIEHYNNITMKNIIDNHCKEKRKYYSYQKLNNEEQLNQNTLLKKKYSIKSQLNNKDYLISRLNNKKKINW